MIPTSETPTGQVGTVVADGGFYYNPPRRAIRTPDGLVCIRAFGRWYGYRTGRLARSFKAAS